MSKPKFARRAFLKKAMTATAAVPLASIPLTLKAQEKLSEDNPQAVALGYRHDAAEVDTKKFPQRGTEEGQKQFCSNCQLYQAQEGGWGTCSIFPGKLVNENGWCSAWIAAS